MKKYFAAAVVAVMVFAFAAFAASFDVDNSVLAVGDGDVGSCTENVEIISYGYEGDSGSFGNVSVSLDQACYDDHGGDVVIFAHFLDGDGDPVGQTEEMIVPEAGSAGERLTLNVRDVGGNVIQTPGGPHLPVEPIEAVRFGIHTKTDAS